MEAPWSHPTVNPTLSATISERMSAVAGNVDSAAIMLLHLKQFENWLYHTPELTEILQKQVLGTAGKYQLWKQWLKQEKVNERKKAEKEVLDAQRRQYQSLQSLLISKAPLGGQPDG